MNRANPTIRSSGRSLGDDVVIEILSRLPLKSLKRFQCVGKSWRSLIADVIYRRRTLRPAQGLFLYADQRKPVEDYFHEIYAEFPADQPGEVKIPFESHVREVWCYDTSFAIHSCDGLFLVRNRPKGYLVCNPTTKERVILPMCTQSMGYSFCFLAFDPRISPHFEVVRFSLATSPEFLMVRTFSSMTRTWVESELAHPGAGYNVDSWLPGTVYHKGAFHIPTLGGYLLIYNLQAKCFPHMVQLPSVLGKAVSWAEAMIGKSGGHLFCAAILPELQVWELREEGIDSQWSPKHSVDIKKIRHHPNISSLGRKYLPVVFCPLAFCPDSEIIFLGLWGDMQIISYHLTSGSVEVIFPRIPATDDRRGLLNWSRVFPFIPYYESIDPPGGKIIRP